MTNDIIQTPVLIIGAGPSGATASLFLSQKGIDHCIVDAATFPRDKVCGDGLDLKVVRVLNHLDPSIARDEIPAHAGFMPIFGSRFTMQSGRKVDFASRDPRPLFWTSKRLCFDDFLVKKLDPRTADFRQGTAVEKIEKTDSGWEVQATCSGRPLTIRSPLLIAADGDHSVMLRYLGERKIDRQHYAATLRQYWRGVADFSPKNLIEIYFPKGMPMSYFYMFPLPNDEVNVGYGMVSSVAARYHHNLRDLFERIIHEDPYVAPRFAGATPLEKPIGWGIPLASRRRRAFGDGYLLTGDAASLVCPTSGEGIGTGMISGYIAAIFAEKALKNKDFRAEQFKYYDREIYRRLEDEIRAYHLMMRVSPHLYDFALNLMAPNPLFQWSFHRRTEGWLRTAYERPIEVTC